MTAASDLAARGRHGRRVDAGVRDAVGQALAAAGMPGYGSVSWDRSRFRNDLTVADPAALHLFLAEHGVPHQLAMFQAPLTDRSGAGPPVPT